jgi:hypothetical protein
MVTSEDICSASSPDSDESFSPRRIKLDLIASILGMGGMRNNNDYDDDDDDDNTATNLENEFDFLRGTMRELSPESEIIEDYLSLLQRKGFIEYDYRGNNKTYRTTPRGLFILQLYHRITMFIH